MRMVLPHQRRGLMLVLSSPSGAGKTTIARALLECDDHIKMSISMTTRSPRPGEIHGKDYFFVTQKDFQERLEEDAFLEHAKVFDHHYGTPKDYVFDTLKIGKDVIFDIDWQGTQQLSLYARDDLVSVFILPPSLNELEERLLSRGQDSMDVMKKRMEKAGDEMSHWAEYDYVIVNHDLEQSIQQVLEILRAERLKRTRQWGLVEFVKTLRSHDGI